MDTHAPTRTIERLTGRGWLSVPQGSPQVAGDVWRYQDSPARIFVTFAGGALRAYDAVEAVGIGDTSGPVPYDDIEKHREP